MFISTLTGRIISIAYDQAEGSLKMPLLFINNPEDVSIRYEGKDTENDIDFVIEPNHFSIETNTDATFSHSHKITINPAVFDVFGLDMRVRPLQSTPHYRFVGKFILNSTSHGQEEQEMDIHLGAINENTSQIADGGWTGQFARATYNKTTQRITFSTTKNHLFWIGKKEYVKPNTPRYFVQFKPIIVSSNTIIDKTVFGRTINQIAVREWDSMYQVDFTLIPTAAMNQLENGTYNIYGWLTDIIQKQNDEINYRSIHIELTVGSQENLFEVSPGHFNFELDEEEPQKTGSFSVRTDGVTPTVTFPPEIKLTQKEENTNTYHFQTPHFKELTKIHSAFEVLVSNGTITKTIRISIKKQTYDLTPLPLPYGYFFCQDGNTFEYYSQDYTADFLEVKMSCMLDNERIERTYQFAFFKGKVSVEHGLLVQPFLSYPKWLDQWLNRPSKPSFFAIATPVKVDFVLTEKSFSQEISGNSVSYTHYYYAGKTPKAFPMLTNATTRSTNTQSLFAVPFINTWENLTFAQRVFKGAKPIDNPRVAYEPYGVYCFWGKRHWLNQKYAGNEIVTFIDRLTLEPKPEMQTHINVIFINQNNCPDWFTFNGFWEDEFKVDFELKNELIHKEFIKTSTKKRTTLKLSTGALFWEEIDLLRELITSPIAWIQIGEKWCKAVPISDKSIAHNNLTYIHSQVVEFQIIEDEIKPFVSPALTATAF